MSASTVALPRLLRARGAGQAFISELTQLSKLLDAPERPFVVIIGGEDVGEGFSLIESLTDRVALDAIIAGGPIGNTLLGARGVNMKATPVDAALFARGRALLRNLRDRKIELHLPLDFVARDVVETGATQTVRASALKDGMQVVDIGPETLDVFRARAQRAKTVLWYGALESAPRDAASSATVELARTLAETASTRVVIESAQVPTIPRTGEDLVSKLGFVSAGARASLDFLEGRRLPGVDALRGGAT
jgi:phosphoglycerate kinase